MPNSISNHFALTALQEGVTVTGSLRVNGSLAQNFNPRTSACVPDWKTDAGSRPSVYPVIRRGSTYMSRAQIYNAKWMYNDVEITFGSDGKSTNFKDASGASLFQLGTTSVELGGTSYSLDLLTIIGNVASEGNTDLDTISYSGSVEVNGKQLAFPTTSVDIKIAQFSSTGYLGLLTPESAIISAKTGAGSSVTITAKLYDDAGKSDMTWYCKWYNMNTGAEISNNGAKTLTVTEAQVTDNMVIRCDFFTDSACTNKVTTAFASIDDTQDPEYLYISLNNKNSDFSGQLSPGESCTVTMWVATMEDSTAINNNYTQFAIRFYDGTQAEIGSGTPGVTVSNHKGTCTITYDFIAQHGYKIVGIVTAQ